MPCGNGAVNAPVIIKSSLTIKADNIDEAFFEKPETRAAISSAVADQINAKAGKKVVSKASVLVTGVKVVQGRRGRARALAGKSVTADYMILNQGSSKETAALSSAVENIGTDAASGTAITAALKAGTSSAIGRLGSRISSSRTGMSMLILPTFAFYSFPVLFLFLFFFFSFCSALFCSLMFCDVLFSSLFFSR